MRFLHAADIHLDSPLKGLDSYEGAPVELLRGATRQALTALVKLAIAERVAFVVLAGDLYDGDWPDYNTGLFLVKQMQQLQRANIPVVLLRGNHDAESRITGRLTLPPNVHSLETAAPSTVRFESLKVALHGQGFAKQAETRNLAANYPAPVPGYYNIGVLHTALGGREGHANYAPCSVDELIARGYDYWALGHIHQRESVNGNRHSRIEFPGNVQGRHIRETGAKGCLLVTVEGSVSTPEFHPLDVLRWELVAVDGVAAESPSELIDRTLSALEEARSKADGRPLAVRLVITCPEAIRWQAAANAAEFRADLCGQAGTDVWIEKVKWQQPAGAPSAAPLLGNDAMGEIRTVLAELQAAPDAVQEILASGDCERLLKKLPAEVRNLLKESWPDIVARSADLLLASTEETVA